MTKMSDIPIYGKKPFKIFFFGTGGPMSMKLDSSMPQVLQCIYKSGPKGKLAGNWQMNRILIILKKKGPKASSAPILRLFSIILKHGYWYIQLISGERLQDHLSSGCLSLNKTLSHGDIEKNKILLGTN